MPIFVGRERSCSAALARQASKIATTIPAISPTTLLTAALSTAIALTATAFSSHIALGATPDDAPASTAAIETQRAQHLADKANRAYGSGEYKTAVELYSVLLQLQPNDARVFYNRANSYSKLDEFDRALADYTAAIARAPDFAAALVNRGSLHFRAKRFDEALSDYDTAAKIRPDDRFIAYNRGLILAQQGRLEEANKAFDRVLEVSSTYAPAYAEKGFLSLQQGDSDKARTQFETTLKYQPANARAEAGLKRLDDNTAAADRLSREVVHAKLIADLIRDIDETCFTNGEDTRALGRAVEATPWRGQPTMTSAGLKTWTGKTSFGKARLVLAQSVQQPGRTVCSITIEGITPHLFKDFRAAFNEHTETAATKTATVETADGAGSEHLEYWTPHHHGCDVHTVILNSTKDNRLTVRMTHGNKRPAEM
ncbi:MULTISPECIES: tetratricopeptide repeat protein [unclassified Hyphomicrobium]|uniref:tetratricopeptide repeat protein n=1 Tax=unclassified Hyphomicrobium TaxID=2619925 RepID=UPI000213EAF7|nr:MULTISPECIES: tetratricopeptide repeat protein [unclassified Hyphomicrobium]CCB64746.1 exported protein of unknown function [Hyphomicrobium sp. MC1]